MIVPQQNFNCTLEFPQTTKPTIGAARAVDAGAKVIEMLWKHSETLRERFDFDMAQRDEISEAYRGAVDQITTLTRERDEARADQAAMARRELEALRARVDSGTPPIQHTDYTRGVASALEHAADWINDRLASLPAEKPAETVPFEGDPKDCAFPKGWKPSDLRMGPVLYWLDDGKFARAMLVGKDQLVVDLTTGDGPSVIGRPDWWDAGYVAAFGGLVPECASEGTEPGQWSYGVAQLPSYTVAAIAPDAEAQIVVWKRRFIERTTGEARGWNPTEAVRAWTAVGNDAVAMMRSLAADNAKAQAEVERLTNLLDDTCNEAATLRDDLETARAEIATCDRRRPSTMAHMEDLRAKLAEAERAVSFATASQQVEQGLAKDAEAHVSHLEVKLAEAEKQRDEREEQVSIQQQLIDEVTVACGSLGLMQSELPKHVADLRAKLATAEAEVVRLAGRTGYCAECESLAKRLAEAEKERNEARSALNELATALHNPALQGDADTTLDKALVRFAVERLRESRAERDAALAARKAAADLMDAYDEHGVSVMDGPDSWGEALRATLRAEQPKPAETAKPSEGDEVLRRWLSLEGPRTREEWLAEMSSAVDELCRRALGEVR